MRDTRERLLRAASELIEEGGYAPASVQAIAKGAGLANGALYRHFPSKAELFVEVFRMAGEHELAAMRAAAECLAGFAERFEAVIRTCVTRFLGSPRLAWALIYEPVDPKVDTERIANRRRYRRALAELLREGIAAGAIPAQDVDLTAAAIVGAITDAVVGPLARGPDAKVVEAIVGFCRGAVGLPVQAPT